MRLVQDEGAVLAERKVRLKFLNRTSVKEKKGSMILYLCANGYMCVLRACGVYVCVLGTLSKIPSVINLMRVPCDTVLSYRIYKKVA